MLTIDARLSGNPSGLGTYVRNVIPGIIRAIPDIPVTLMGNRPDFEKLGWLDYANVLTVPFPAKMYSLAEQLSAGRKIPRRTGLLFAPHYNIPVMYGGRMLVTVHDLCHLASPATRYGLFHKAYARLLFDTIRKRAVAVLTNSQFTKDEFVRLTRPSDQPVIPIHLGVSETWRASRASEKSGPGYIVFVGNAKLHKNLRGLLAAYKLIADEVPQTIAIVGYKEEVMTHDPEVRELANGLEGRIWFTGRLDEERLRSCVAGAAVLVLPSFYEGFGFTPIEAMAAGCPVAVSDIPVLREICGGAAVYFDPFDCRDIAKHLKSILGDRELRSALRLKGTARARELNWDRCVRTTTEVIRALLEHEDIPAV